MQRRILVAHEMSKRLNDDDVWDIHRLRNNRALLAEKYGAKINVDDMYDLYVDDVASDDVSECYVERASFDEYKKSRGL